MLTYDGNGSTAGTVPSDPASYNPGTSVTLLGNIGNLVKTGYVFVGWSISPNDPSTSYGSGSILILNSATILYALWNPILTYNSNGSFSGTVPSDPVSYSPGSTVTVSGNTGNLVRTGYVFAGWVTGTGYLTGSSLILTSPTTLYARWHVTLTYISNGSASTASYSPGSSVTIAGKGNLVKSGYIFGGWSSGSKFFVPGEKMTINSETALTAWWYPE